MLGPNFAASLKGEDKNEEAARLSFNRRKEKLSMTSKAGGAVRQLF
jgi:hypothetical protein